MILKSTNEGGLFSEFLKNKKNIRIVYVILIIGIALLSFSSFVPEKKTVSETSMDMIDYETEKKLQKILSEMEGVGSADVMITYKSKGEVVPAVNKNEKGERENEGEGGTSRDRESLEKQEELVLTGSGSSQSPFILKELTPMVQGVIVIAQGGNNPVVKQNIVEAVTVLTGVPPHNVGVFSKKK